MYSRSAPCTCGTTRNDNASWTDRAPPGGASDSVLHAVARALQLDEAEHAHLFDLARTANTTATAARTVRRPVRQHLRPGVQRILDAMTTAPAYVRNGRMDILSASQLGYAVFAPIFASPSRQANIARFIFLDPAASDFYLDWDRLASDTVALLRAEAGRDPYDRALSHLIGELSTRSETFRTRWAAHNVRFHRSGVKRLHHPVVGDLTLTYESMELTADAGLRLNAYSAEPGTASQDALNLLASWAATPRQRSDTRAADQA